MGVGNIDRLLKFERSLQANVVGRTPHQQREISRFRSPVIRFDVVKSKFPAVQSNRNRPGFSHFQIYSRETFQLFDRTRNTRVAVTNVQLRYFRALPLSGVRHIEGDSYGAAQISTRR